MNIQEQGAKKIYERNKSRGIESVSGTGSTLDITKGFRFWLQTIISKYEIKSITDIPCGDWNWMSKVDLGGVDYFGGDIVDEIIITNNRKFSYENILFEKFDAINQIPPKSDLIICRDFLFHISFEQAKIVLENFRKSGSKYLISTSFDLNKNSDLTKEQKEYGWGWRKIDLHKYPYLLGEELEYVVEKGMENRTQSLWEF